MGRETRRYRFSQVSGKGKLRTSVNTRKFPLLLFLILAGPPFHFKPDTLVSIDEVTWYYWDTCPSVEVTPSEQRYFRNYKTPSLSPKYKSKIVRVSIDEKNPYSLNITTRQYHYTVFLCLFMQSSCRPDKIFITEIIKFDSLS